METNTHTYDADRHVMTFKVRRDDETDASYEIVVNAGIPCLRHSDTNELEEIDLETAEELIRATAHTATDKAVCLARLWKYLKDADKSDRTAYDFTDEQQTLEWLKNVQGFFWASADTQEERV